MPSSTFSSSTFGGSIVAVHQVAASYYSYLYLHYHFFITFFFFKAQPKATNAAAVCFATVGDSANLKILTTSVHVIGTAQNGPGSLNPSRRISKSTWRKKIKKKIWSHLHSLYLAEPSEALCFYEDRFLVVSGKRWRVSNFHFQRSSCHHTPCLVLFRNSWWFFFNKSFISISPADYQRVSAIQR